MSFRIDCVMNQMMRRRYQVPHGEAPFDQHKSDDQVSMYAVDFIMVDRARSR